MADSFEPTPAPVYTSFSAGGDNASRRAFLQAMYQASTNPVERAGLAFDLAATPASSEGESDPAAPQSQHLLSDPPLASLKAKAALAIAAIMTDDELPPAVKEKKLSSLRPGREQDVRELPAALEKSVNAFLAANRLPNTAMTPDTQRALESINYAIAHWLPGDVVQLLETSGHANPDTLDVVRATLRRISEAPPKAWESTARNKAVGKAIELLMTLPRGKMEVASERWKRANEIADATRKRWIAAATYYVATGR